MRVTSAARRRPLQPAGPSSAERTWTRSLPGLVSAPGPAVWRTPRAEPLEPQASGRPDSTQALPLLRARPPPGPASTARLLPTGPLGPGQSEGPAAHVLQSSDPPNTAPTRSESPSLRQQGIPSARLSHILITPSHRCHHLQEVWEPSQASAPGAAPPVTAAVPEAAPALERPSPASVGHVAAAAGVRPAVWGTGP